MNTDKEAQYMNTKYSVRYAIQKLNQLGKEIGFDEDAVREDVEDMMCEAFSEE